MNLTACRSVKVRARLVPTPTPTGESAWTALSARVRMHAPEHPAGAAADLGTAWPDPGALHPWKPFVFNCVVGWVKINS
jgi:hypothetical protein